MYQQGKYEDWVPIQSDPELWNQYIGKLGVNIDKYQFQQLLSLEQWGYAQINQPILGLVFLYDETQKQVAYQQQQAKTLDIDKFMEQQYVKQQHKQLYFMLQFADNACGSIAVYHIILNNLGRFDNILQGNQSIFRQFYQQSQGETPEKRGHIFRTNQLIKNQHVKYSQQGQSEVREDVREHYIALIHYEGDIYELNGCKLAPICHGSCDQDKFLQQGCKTIKKILSRDPDSINCSVIALSKKPAINLTYDHHDDIL